MARIFVFDSDPTGLACHHSGGSEAVNFRVWLAEQWASSLILVIPEIIDYEVRRSLILAESWNSMARLDDLYQSGRVRHLPITTPAMRRAAELWAEARNKGYQTADNRAIDGDVILAAQAIEFCSDTDDWAILTENVGHIARYVGGRARSRRDVIADWLRSTPEAT